MTLQSNLDTACAAKEMALVALAVAESALAENVGLQTPAADAARVAYRIAAIGVADADDAQAKARADLADALMLEAAKSQYRATARRNNMLDARARLHGPALLYTDAVFKEWILALHDLTDDQVDALQIERAELAARPVCSLRTD